MLSRFKAVNESVMLADDMPTSFTYYIFHFILFLIINVIVTDVDVAKVTCY